LTSKHLQEQDSQREQEATNECDEMHSQIHPLHPKRDKTDDHTVEDNRQGEY
jgi:hypothetical protein